MTFRPATGDDQPTPRRADLPGPGSLPTGGLVFPTGEPVPGGRPADVGRGGEGAGGGVPQDAEMVPIGVPDRDAIVAALTQLEIGHGIDDDGDVVTGGEDFRVYFLLRGEQSEIYTIRYYLGRVLELEEKPLLLDLLDEWNRDFSWPKAFTHTDDAGNVRVIAECHLDCEPGVTPQLFTFTTAAWFSCIVRFHGWLADRLSARERD